MAFFEQIGKHVTDAGQNVAQQTKNLMDVTQLNNVIAEKEKRISQIFLSIGKSYYEKHKNDATAEESEMINEINSLYIEIMLNREKINQIRGMLKCEQCGADVPLHAAFCNACGARIVRMEIIREESRKERLCPACHKIIENGNVFCIYCGTKVENS